MWIDYYGKTDIICIIIVVLCGCVCSMICKCYEYIDIISQYEYTHVFLIENTWGTPIFYVHNYNRKTQMSANDV